MSSDVERTAMGGKCDSGISYTTNCPSNWFRRRSNFSQVPREGKNWKGTRAKINETSSWVVQVGTDFPILTALEGGVPLSTPELENCPRASVSLAILRETSELYQINKYVMRGRLRRAEFTDCIAMTVVKSRAKLCVSVRLSLVCSWIW